VNLSQCQPHTAHKHGDGSLSGEPLPVEKTIGGKVMGGTVNGTGGFVMRAARVDKNYIHGAAKPQPKVRISRAKTQRPQRKGR
jgi:Cu+-exporting ATPase